MSLLRLYILMKFPIPMQIQSTIVRGHCDGRKERHKANKNVV